MEVITIVIISALLLLAISYITWVRHQLRNVILTNTGLFAQLENMAETNELLKQKISVQHALITELQKDVQKRVDIAEEVSKLVGKLNIKNLDKINIVTRLK